MSDSVSMEQTADGNVMVSVGDISKVFPDYIQAAEWAETLLYGKGDADGN